VARQREGAGLSNWTSAPRWAIARTARGCDPERYLGELRQLPAAEQREPGEWCELVLQDEDPAMRWTLVIVHDGTERRAS
jgi:hypothetical protein